MKRLVFWVFFLGGGTLRVDAQTISVSNLGLTASGERWCLNYA